jgi:acyl-CoA dehydrogenase
MRIVMTEDHEHFRTQVRRFLAKNVVPHHAQWEKDGIVPRAIWRMAGENGFLCTTVPEEYGGAGGDFGFAAVVIEELARVNASGLAFPLHSDIVSLYILKYGTEEQKQRWLPRMASGEMIGALGLTEPGTGSDLKAIRASAVRDGDSYVINGQKTFISNGINAGIVVVAVKTDPPAGSRGVSLVCVEEGTTGFSKGRKVEKIGLHAQDTSELFFDNVRVPLTNRLGEENKGFGYLMHELAQERLIIALRAATSMEATFETTVAYTRERLAFGTPVFEFQNTRFKLADARAQIEMFRVFVDDCLSLHLQKKLTSERAAMAKLVGTEMQNRLIDDFLQMHGGYGYTSEYSIGRAWTDARVQRIFGGSSEIMKEIIARTL